MNTNAKPKPDASTQRKPLIFVPPDKRCGHRTEKGAPCRAARWRASRFCIFHDPNFRNVRKQLQERKNSAQKQKSTRTAEGIQQMLENAAQDVREKRITPAEASSIGYLGQVMSANLKNLPHAEDTNTPSRDYIDQLAHNWTEVLLDSVNEEIARWIPDSSPMAVAQAERDVVKIAADASAAEAQAAAASTVGASHSAVSEQAGRSPEAREPHSCPLPPSTFYKGPYDP